MTTPDHDDLVKLGFNAVLGGRLSELRDQTGLSRTGMARLIGVDSEALRDYELLRRTMNLETARRVGEWFGAAKRATVYDGEPVDFTTLIPGAGAAMHFQVPLHELRQHCRDNDIDFWDLDALGLFVYRDQVPALIA
jgi:transcriptional regulator with XRE-family HTH domain